MSLLFKHLFKNKRAGFTLVELLVTISIMAIVTAGIFGYSRNNENQNNLNRAQQRLVFELRRAESLAMSNSKNPNDNTVTGKWVRWGITTNSDGTSYDIVSQTCPTGATDEDKGACSPKNLAVSLEKIKLPDGITISPLETSIYFLSPEPTVYDGDTKIGLGGNSIEFTLTNSISNTRKVSVSPIGQINGN